MTRETYLANKITASWNENLVNLKCIPYWHVQSLRRKIKTYIREASFYENAEDRNGTDAAKPAETPGTSNEGGAKNRQMRRIKRGKNEANGDTEREEEDDEGEGIT